MAVALPIPLEAPVTSAIPPSKVLMDDTFRIAHGCVSKVLMRLYRTVASTLSVL
jgi:hypothetical protein